MTQRGDGIESRVSRIESEIESLAQSVNSLTVNVGRIQDNLREELRAVSESMTRAVGALSDQLANRSRTNWGTIAAVATVAVTVVGLIGSMAVQPMQRAIEKIEQTTATKEYEDLRHQMTEAEVKHLREVLDLKTKKP
jgi:cell division septum initiation protein DivIVA